MTRAEAVVLPIAAQPTDSLPLVSLMSKKIFCHPDDGSSGAYGQSRGLRCELVTFYRSAPNPLPATGGNRSVKQLSPTTSIIFLMPITRWTGSDAAHEFADTELFLAGLTGLRIYFLARTRGAHYHFALVAPILTSLAAFILLFDGPSGAKYAQVPAHFSWMFSTLCHLFLVAAPCWPKHRSGHLPGTVPDMRKRAIPVLSSMGATIDTEIAHRSPRNPETVPAPLGRKGAR